jgi:hypothetical protein
VKSSRLLRKKVADIAVAMVGVVFVGVEVVEEEGEDRTGVQESKPAIKEKSLSSWMEVG